MSSSSSHFQSEPAKIEQIITEFFAKSLHIILESRSPSVSSRNFSGEQTASSPSSSSSSSSVRPRDKWFNLALRESPAALENLDIWRQGGRDPLIVDVILIERSAISDLGPLTSKKSLLRNLSLRERSHQYLNPGPEELLLETKSERIIERWVVQYENRKGSGITREKILGTKKTSGGSNQSSEVLAIYKKTYKKSIILLRSLYVTVRLLPAFNLFRDLNSSGQIHPFSLSYKVSSFVEPFTRRDESEMQQFCFVPVDTCCGRLCLSVLYCPTLSDVQSEPSAPMSPQFITDYVGSPTTDPLKRFPCLPLSGLMSRSPGSLSSVPFARRHSWSNDLHRAQPSFSPSPSPTYSDSQALASNLNCHCHLPHRHVSTDISPFVDSLHPPHIPSPSNVSFTHKKDTSFDEYWSSPPFSPSPSPSPPAHLHCNHISKVLIRSESDPVSIPSARLGRSPGLPSHVLPPSPCPKVTKSRYSSHPSNVSAQVSQVSQVSTSQSSPSESKCKAKQDWSRLKELQAGITTHRALPLKDEVGNSPRGINLSSAGSPRISFSRSSSRLSFQDEFEDSEFACPFAVDDEDDLMGPPNRSESFDGKEHMGEGQSVGTLPIRKSQDAAVGELVRMLKSAPPLRPDCSNSSNFSQASKGEHISHPTQITESGIDPSAFDREITASGILMLKTAADALEELKGYRDMKDFLLGQGGLRPMDQRNP